MPKYKGYGKRGRPSHKEIKAMLIAKGIIDHGPKEFYQLTHPKSKPTSTECNFRRILTKEVKDYVKQLLDGEQLVATTRKNLEKLFGLVISGWVEGKEKTSDYLRALENLKELVSDFKKKYEVDNISEKSEEEVNKELKELGIDPGNVRFKKNVPPPTSLN